MKRIKSIEVQRHVYDPGSVKRNYALRNHAKKTLRCLLKKLPSI